MARRLTFHFECIIYENVQIEKVPISEQIGEVQPFSRYSVFYAKIY